MVTELHGMNMLDFPMIYKYVGIWNRRDKINVIPLLRYQKMALSVIKKEELRGVFIKHYKSFL